MVKHTAKKKSSERPRGRLVERVTTQRERVAFGLAVPLHRARLERAREELADSAEFAARLAAAGRCRSAARAAGIASYWAGRADAEAEGAGEYGGEANEEAERAHAAVDACWNGARLR